MRGKNLIKLLRALELLSRKTGTTIAEMAEHLEVDHRSVYRMINMIEELGFPLYDDKVPFEREKRWRLAETYLKKLPNMNIPEVNLTLPVFWRACPPQAWFTRHVSGGLTRHLFYPPSLWRTGGPDPCFSFPYVNK